MVHCTKVVIPVAGYGTRRFPISKTIEKCMLPILNRPIIDYVVEDCLKAGITDFYFVVSETAVQLQDYYSRNIALEEYLTLQGKEAMIPLVQPPKNAQFHFVVQPTAPDSKYGTAVPVWLCRDFIEADEHFLVFMGDDFIYNADDSSVAAQLATAAEGRASAILGVEVPPEDVSQYGVIATQPTEDSQGYRDFAYIQEKPAVHEAHSNLINVSKYLLHANFLPYLNSVIAKEQSGEYYITDALNQYVQAGNTLRVVPSKGVFLDAGTTESWLAANNYMAKMAQAT